MDGGEAQVARQAAGGRAGIHPGKFKRDQCEGQVFRTFQKAPILCVEEGRRDPAFIKRRQEAGLFSRPFVGVARPFRHEASYRSTSYGAGSLDQHGQVIAVGETPHDLPQIVSGLLAGGLAPDTPATVIEQGTLPQQKQVVTTIALLPLAVKQQQLASPALIVVGAVARLAQPEVAAQAARMAA